LEWVFESIGVHQRRSEVQYRLFGRSCRLFGRSCRLFRNVEHALFGARWASLFGRLERHRSQRREWLRNRVGKPAR